MPHTGLKYLNANFICCATELLGKGGDIFFYLFRIWLHFFCCLSTLTNYCKHFPKNICREFISQVGYILYVYIYYICIWILTSINNEFSSYWPMGFFRLEVAFVTSFFNRNKHYTLMIPNPLTNHQYQKIPRSENPMCTHPVGGGANHTPHGFV